MSNNGCVFTPNLFNFYSKAVLRKLKVLNINHVKDHFLLPIRVADATPQLRLHELTFSADRNWKDCLVSIASFNSLVQCVVIDHFYQQNLSYKCMPMIRS